jgi:MFS transporter, DHA2 family, multidrug resistance protein
MTGTDANTQEPRPAVTTQPLSVAGVLLDALIAAWTGRLMNVRLADIRGALHFGVNVGGRDQYYFQRFHDVYRTFFVYLRGLLGPRRVLLAAHGSSQ